MDFLERVALWAVVLVCVVLLRVLIRAVRRGGGRMPAPPPNVPMPHPPMPRHQAPVQAASPPMGPPPYVPPPPQAPRPLHAPPPPIGPPPAARPAVAQTKPPGAARFEIVGLSGEYAGQHFRPGDTELVFGRDAAMVHVVYPQNFSDISKRHCRLFANSAGRVWIEDTWSANGTFIAELKPGQPAATTRLTAGTPHELQPGDAFCLAGPGQMFRLEKKA